MGNLYLSGGGNKEQGETVNLHFAHHMDRKKTLLYIPIAGDPNYRSYESSFAYICSTFRPLGIRSMTMWTDIQHKKIDDLKIFSAVYIGGGDAFSLLKACKSSGFDHVLKQYVGGGGTIYGQSAGGIILGKTINVLSQYESYDANHPDANALNFVGDRSITCHYQKEHDILIREYIRRSSNPVFAIPEGTAIYQNSKGQLVIGNHPVYCFNEACEYTVFPNQHI